MANLAVQSKRISIHRIVDLDLFAIPLETIFPDGRIAALNPFAEALADRHVDFAAGKVLLTIQSHLLRFGGKTVLIDTCVGEHKARPLRPEWNQRSATGYLANLAAAGCAPQDIDIVMCTHLHADHVGWNTRLESGRWVPTFPNARYVMSQREIDQRAQEAANSPAANHGSFQDSVLPILNAGLAQVQKPGDRIVDDALIVDLAGHAPGQIGLDVAAGRDAHFLFCGDAIHSPVQVFWPDWSSGFCLDRVQAAQTRRALLRRAADEDLRLVPGHLRGMTMRVAERNGGFIPLLNN
ncbi:MAG: MBL fold metallo-hydrolase [Xanthobacteraceae bacterium]|jgi:glyoxylase-like metal-dependent hydrolase (beta-lactamase superfamily II)